MSEDHPEEPYVPNKFTEHRLVVLVIGSIIIALILVAFSMTLYRWSGAAQLDLTRPGFKSVQNKTKPLEKYSGFPSDGPIDAATLKNFKELYSKQAAEVTGIDVFSGDVLSDQVLKIDDPDQQQAAAEPEQ